MSDALRFPVGHPTREGELTPARRQELISQIAAAPILLREAVAGLRAQQLDTPYRLGGWTVRQVVLHVSDSHIHAYARFKWALTEECPRIKPYDQDRWAALVDSQQGDVDTSIQLLEGLHKRWVTLLNELDDSAFRRTLDHPEEGLLTLDDLLCIYAWHGRHHAAHITGLRTRNGW